jgi:hypothetical protein
VIPDARQPLRAGNRLHFALANFIPPPLGFGAPKPINASKRKGRAPLPWVWQTPGDIETA